MGLLRLEGRSFGFFLRRSATLHDEKVAKSGGRTFATHASRQIEEVEMSLMGTSLMYNVANITWQ